MLRSMVMDISASELGSLGFGTGQRTRSPKTSERIARELANFIVERDLPEGAKLPTEKEMVESFGVGRTTLREALRLLETRSVIAIRSGPRGGPIVRRPQPSDMSESLTLILQFEGASFGDVMHALLVLEPMITRMAARKIDAARLKQLRKLVDIDPSNEAWLRAHRRFHSLIAEAAGNVSLQIFSDTLQSVMDGPSTTLEASSNRHADIHQSAEKIMEALAARDEDAAEVAMREHLEDILRDLKKHHAHLLSERVRWTPS